MGGAGEQERRQQLGQRTASPLAGDAGTKAQRTMYISIYTSRVFVLSQEIGADQV